MTSETEKAIECIREDSDRFVILQDIVGHSKKAPSMDELVHANPNLTRGEIIEHLGALADNGVVESVELSMDDWDGDSPLQFFRLSDKGRELMDTYGMLKAEDTVEMMWDILEKPPHIKACEDAPRPEDFDD